MLCHAITSSVLSCPQALTGIHKHISSIDYFTENSINQAQPRPHPTRPGTKATACSKTWVGARICEGLGDDTNFVKLSSLDLPGLFPNLSILVSSPLLPRPPPHFTPAIIVAPVFPRIFTPHPGADHICNLVPKAVSAQHLAPSP